MPLNTDTAASEAEVLARFEKDTADHELTILHDDGLYRHLLVKVPGSSFYWFEVEVMTYRERREARAERLRGWAEKRQTNAEAVFEANRPFTTDHAFNTQPGHIPLRARIIRQEDRAFESLQKAERMAARADSIEAQAAHAIYSDDEDAVERLRERVAKLEAQREHVKTTNAAYRKAHKAELAAMNAYERNQAMPFPSYVLQNLGGNITRNRKRLAHLERNTP